ncbi:MAG TPA: hypothetical protein VGM97_17095 [Steroidobacteraceae bacterium]|jgi:hypothetical protein
MKGIARTVVQLIYGSGLQRWLLRIGLCVTILGFGALKSGWFPHAQPLFAFSGALAAGITIISPVVVGAIMFRALSAPRSVQLIPHGRLKLVSGAFSAQVLLTLFITAAMTTLLTDGPRAHASLLGTTTTSGLMAVIFAYAFSILTFIFLNFYWAMQFRFAATIWLLYVIGPRLLSHAFPQLHLGARLDTSQGVLTLFIISVLAWPAFAAIFIRQRRIGVLVEWKLVGLNSAPAQRTFASATQAGTAPDYGRPQAMRIALTGIASHHKVTLTAVVIAGAAFLAALLVTGGKVSNGAAFAWAFMICAFTGIAPAIRTGLMTLRAKSLWLTARLDREDLFAAVERHSWSALWPLAGTAMALSTILLLLRMHGALTPTLLVSVLAVPLTIGASGIYVSLLLVRGRRLGDTLFLAAYTVLLMVEIFSAVLRSQTLPVLLGVNIVALPLVRHMALRRWQNIDWLIHKRLVAQLTG